MLVRNILSFIVYSIVVSLSFTEVCFLGFCFYLSASYVYTFTCKISITFLVKIKVTNPSTAQNEADWHANGADCTLHIS